MDDIEERKRIQAGLETMLLIANTGPFMRSAIFHTNNASKKRRELEVLKKLCDRKILASAEVTQLGVNVTYYSIKNLAELERICRSEKQVSALIWGQEPTVPPPTPVTSAPATPVDAKPLAPASRAKDVDDGAMQDIVKLLRAVCESMIYTREKVDKLEEEVAYLRKGMDELLKVWK